MGILSYLSSFLFQYQTPRVVSIRSKRIGATYRIIQLLLIIYLIGYVFLYEKNYQSREAVTSSVVTKVKGTLVRIDNGSTEIWDSSDFVVPAQESNAFFIATNLIYTGNQTQCLCPEDRNVGVSGII
ncbi:hypothetical protein RvY_08057-2 [Ramazzottius varieornatus]|uniref:Uncharacterized protein n=1 Tax=Ramazzottius varieornatus TaxID=947166 RepID=A0A1D1V786_RAMVA|nr:hypothetical protein RvY_08057-2 [Ramazzottius varieornatus]